MRTCWSVLVGSILLLFAYETYRTAGKDWLISIPIVFMIGDILQWRPTAPSPGNKALRGPMPSADNPREGAPLRVWR